MSENTEAITFGQRFQRTKGLPFKYGDKLVHSIYTRQYSGSGVVTIRFESANTNIRQALCLAARRGSVEINGLTIKKTAVLWSNTAPSSVDVKYRFKSDGEVRFWNAWEDAQGVQHAWIGNAGMLVSDTGGKVTLSCSDGIGDPDFADLAVIITNRQG